MKKQKLLTLIVTLVIFSGLVWANRASAWTATFRAVGENRGGINQRTISIGVQKKAQTFPLPPPAPFLYSIKMELYTVPNWQTVAEDYRQEGKGPYTWVIGIDPIADIPSHSPQTITLSWDPSEFGPGLFYELREGSYGTGAIGPIIVADMRTTTSYDVVGGPGVQYFTIRAVSIPGAIWLLGSGLIGILGVRRKLKK